MQYDSLVADLLVLMTQFVSGSIRTREVLWAARHGAT